MAGRYCQARQTTAARVIFLWLRRRRLFTRLARQTSRRLQQEAPHQEAARAAQCLLHEHANHERQVEAARTQRLLDKETACGVIFLWLRRRRLFARLAGQTSRRLQHEAALARMQHEQECCARALQAEEQRWQAAAARAKTIADEATARHQQAEETRWRAALAKAKCHKDTLATEERQRAALAAAKHEAAAWAAEALALIEESRRHEAVLAAETDD